MTLANPILNAIQKQTHPRLWKTIRGIQAYVHLVIKPIQIK